MHGLARFYAQFLRTLGVQRHSLVVHDWGSLPSELAAAGADLGRLECPALVVWSDRDTYLPLRFGRAYAERLPNADLVTVKEGGHWPWLERPRM
jgi:pimeloyl-ACP methyl ester carboxylesterase